MLIYMIIYYENFDRLRQKEAYKRVEQLGDRLAEIKSLMDWEAFLSAGPIVGDMYDNRSERGGRPEDIPDFTFDRIVFQRAVGEDR
jgi:hypothetical protein